MSESAYQNQVKAIHAAQLELNSTIEKWINRIAVNNEVSIDEAKKLLSRSELTEFRWSLEEYIKYGEENAFNQKWIKELENASAKIHIERFQATKLQIQKQLEILAFEQNRIATNLVKNVYKETYFRGAYEIAKGTNTGLMLGEFDDIKLTKVASTILAPDGRHFSERIWTQTISMQNQLNQELMKNIVLGKNPKEAINNMTKFVNSKIKNKKRAVKALVFTEQAYYSSLAQRELFVDLGIDDFEIISTLDSITSDICRELDGEIFPLSLYEVGVTAPPFHVFCRTTTAPNFDKEDEELGITGELSESTRAARDKNGETYYVPSDITYKEWYNQYVRPKILTKDEKRALNWYMGSSSYKVNDKLRSNTELKETEQEYIESLDSALDKMPNYVGDLTRSLDFQNQLELEKFIEAHKVGNIIRYPAYTSTTTGETYNPSGQVQITILNSNNGKDIRSYNKSEQEVLYKRNSAFIITNSELIDGTYYIELEEMYD